MLFKSHPIRPEFYGKPHAFEIHAPSGDGPFPVIFQTPILGRFILLEDLFFERRFARFFASQGLACVLIHRPIFEFNPSKGLSQIQKYIEESLERSQAVLESVRKDSRFDSENMGTFGMSFGGIINCLWAADEPRFKAHVLAMAGGNLPEIFLRSPDPLMKSYRKAALACAGGDFRTLKRHLISIFTRDPLSAAAQLPAEKIMLILGIFDRIVPFFFGNKLRNRLGYPKTVFIPLGHYFSIIAVPIIKWQVANFFKKKFTSPIRNINRGLPIP